MIERFRLNCAHIFVLSILLHSIASYCRPEFVKDAISNAETSNYIAEEQRSKVDPLIEQIFRGPIEKRNDATDTKQNLEKDTQPYQEADKHVRTKRENSAKKNNQKTLNEATKNEEKRSLKPNKVSSRSMRSSRGLPKVADRSSSDYDTSADQDASEYVDEAEEEPATSSRNKESGYKSREFHVGEDSDRFIDQEERSSLYDDFEPKDVAKRGVSGAEDYEELDEESVEPEDDTALDEQDSLEDEGDKKKVRGDTRVKREHYSSKEAEVSQVQAKPEDAASLSDSSSDASNPDASLKRDAIPEGSDSSKAESTDQEYLKRNAAEKQEEVKVSPDAEVSKQSSSISDQTEVKNNENSKASSQEIPETAAERKTPEDASLSGDKTSNHLASESSELKGPSKLEESKVADVSSPEAPKVDSVAETSVSKDVAKLDSSKNVEGIPQDQDGDYEKRVEEQIQRKIDSIKEEIKREIAEKQRMKAIEENNAKFDELHELEDDDEQDAESEPSEKRENLAKRSAKNSGKSRTREIADKRSTRRKKRQNDGQDKVESTESDSSKKSARETSKKRPSRSQLTPILRETTVQKRDNPREVILVRSERNTGKKKRRRRSKSSKLVKIEDNLPADLLLDSNLRDADNGKVNKDEKATEQDSLSEKKSGSVASLTGNGVELGPLATEYGEAFGGLHGEPGVALARFKRIKRVLRPQSLKT